MGQGPDGIMGLVEKVDVITGSLVYFDNLFTSVPLLERLSSKGVGGTGIVTTKRMMAIPLPLRNTGEKTYERGHYSVL